MIEKFENMERYVKDNPMNGILPTPSVKPEVIPVNNCNEWLTNRIGLAQAYTPVQQYMGVMDEEQSLACGTAFSQLSQPYKKGIGAVKA